MNYLITRTKHAIEVSLRADMGFTSIGTHPAGHGTGRARAPCCSGVRMIWIWTRDPGGGASVDLPLCSNDTSREGGGIIRPGACPHEMAWWIRTLARCSLASRCLSQSQVKSPSNKNESPLDHIYDRPAHHTGPNNINDHGNTTVWASLTTENNHEPSAETLYSFPKLHYNSRLNWDYEQKHRSGKTIPEVI